MSEIIEFFAIVVSAVLATIAAILLFMCLWSAGPARWECQDVAKQGYSTDYGFWSGCFVTMPDGKRMYWADARKVLTQEYKAEITQK